MTNRERAMNILHYKDADRLPAVHFGYWGELLVEKAEQGKIPKELAENNWDGNEKDKILDELIGWDFNWSCTRGANSGLYPRFEEKVLEVLPEIFDELCAKHYKKRNDLCHEYGIDIISLDCDGVPEKLLPTWFENGVNTMFPIEIGVWGDQFEPARKKYGKGMLGVGGMDKTALRKDKATVDAEMERIKRLAAMGGFIPCPDHRLMPGTKFELVPYYAQEIKKIRL